MATSNQVELPLLTERPNAVVRTGGPQLLRGLMLPMPPSKNNWMRAVNKGPLAGRTLLTEDARKYKNTIAELAMVKRFRFSTTKPLRINLLLCPPDRRRRDAHNYIGQLMDALQDAQVFEDDSQAEDVRIQMGPIMVGGRIIVSMWEIQPDKQALLTAAMRGDE